MLPDVWLAAVLAELARAGIDPTSWARAWARLIPSLVLIPALGLPAFPIGLRVAFALMLGASVAPGLLPAADPSAPLLATLASELARGVPVALSVAICVWGASMAGQLIDELRGGGSPARSPFDGSAPASPFGVLLSLAAALAFLELGGPARLSDALASARPLAEQDLTAVARALAYGLRFAVVLAGPLLALVPFVELLHALMARATHPIALGVVMAPLKAMTLLGVAALLLDRFATGVVLWMDRALPPS
ncbi:MAG TPA: flagellar biosynthetic protein FliR [Polyangiaceae bacterium]|nr:flagellar biosynthetic protein FliR [Polyangiaceae bacterium]